jgi:hypothetical protein
MGHRLNQSSRENRFDGRGGIRSAPSRHSPSPPVPEPLRTADNSLSREYRASHVSSDARKSHSRSRRTLAAKSPNQTMTQLSFKNHCRRMNFLANYHYYYHHYHMIRCGSGSHAPVTMVSCSWMAKSGKFRSGT